MTTQTTDKIEPRKRYPDGTYSMYAVRVTTSQITHVKPILNRVIEINAVEFDGSPDPRSIAFRRYQPAKALSTSQGNRVNTYERWYVGLSEQSMARLRKVLGVPTATNWLGLAQ